MQPKVSIITVNFNGIRFLKYFFESIKDLHYDNIELIFVDNASTDGSADYVRQNWADVKVIDNKINLGFSIANNIAAERASGEYLFFLNNDTKVHPDVISELVKRMSENSALGICGCTMMSYDGSVFFHTGIGVDILGFPIASRVTFYAEGSALMIRKQLFKEVGEFDPEYFMFHEDVDLAWRVWLSGYQVIAIAEAVVYHYIGASAGGTALIKEGQYKSTYFRRYFSERNNIRTVLKNYGFPVLPFILIVYFLISLAEMVFFLVFLKPKVIFCYLKAYRWNMVNFNETLIARKKIQGIRKVPDSEILKKMYKGIGKMSALKKVSIPSFG